MLRRVRAEPGLAPERDAGGALVHDAQGDLVLAHTSSRWVGTGRTVVDNKGNPVKQYEPFFSATHEYEDEAELVEWGVTPILRYDPLGRLIQTDLPNGTFSRVVFDAWKQTSHDPNDTVLESAWYAARQALPAGDPERRAADLAAAHAGTPAISHLDALGRVFRAVADNGAEGQYVTQTTLDIEGQPLAITDARGNQAMLHRFGMGGQLLYQKSNDGGARWMLAGATGQRLRAWNGRGFVYRSSYDALRRPTHEHVQPASGSERLARRYVYGEAHPQATALNLRGRPYQVYDGAGVVTSLAYDFKGNLLQASRRLRSDVHADADWSVLAALTDVAAIAAAAEPLLEVESFATQTAYDALNRPTSVTTPDTSELRPTYNEAGLLERVEARVRGAAAWTTFVDDIDYDAKGQRERIEYGNGTFTAYTYDPLTFRLTRLKTTRSSDSTVLQNLRYVYDPVGNIVEIGDSAQQTVFFNNDVVSPSAQYVYDAVYRLIEATGREHAGGLSDAPRDQNDLPIQSLPHPNDPQALRNYTEQYVYDAVGNLLRMVHQAGTVIWTRWYAYETANNRLTSTTGDPEHGPFSTYVHDAHGNMTAMPHITALTWDENDQVRSTDLGGGGDVYYDYDAAGQRVRKVWEHSGLVEERIYLGGYEVYRRHNSSGLELERQTLHVMDGARRVAMVETKTVNTSGPFTATPRVRYQLDNHLGSASLEVDGAGLVIGYEEYHPHGTTAYWSAASGIEVSQRRYRYTGKEKDEETGLYYHGARYYAPWLGRWIAADPAGLIDGPNLYAYVRGDPIQMMDPTGLAAETNPEINNLFRGLAAARTNVSAEEFHKFVSKNDQQLHGLLHPFGYQGSRAKAEASLRDFDRAYATWQKIVDSAGSSPGAAAPAPQQGDGEARKKMWEVAARDPVAAAFIGSGVFISATVGRLFGFEQDPETAAAGGEATSALVHAAGGAGANQAVKGQASRHPRGMRRGGRITGDPGVIPKKMKEARAGDASKAAELRVAKMLRNEGKNVHFIDESPVRKTPEFDVSGVPTEVKRLGGIYKTTAKDLAKAVEQVGPGGQVIVVRPADSKATIEQYQDFISGFTPKKPGVTFRVVDEATLPRLQFQE
ncbi:RHS repeat domain-containing protein [Sorangium sp. So ce1128]